MRKFQLLFEPLAFVWHDKNVWKPMYRNAPVLNNSTNEVSGKSIIFDNPYVSQAPIGADTENRNKWNIIIFSSNFS